MSTRQQFNVNLPPDLVRRIKHHAIDTQLSLSDLVDRVFEAHLTQEAAMTSPTPRVKLQPMVHVASMPEAVDFYAALGARVVNGSRDGDFALLELNGSELSLLAHPPNPAQDEGHVELNFVSSGSLSELEDQLRSAGVKIVTPTSDESFGRQLQVASPDGLLVKITELDAELYG
jgi:catechol 2,3-dioxygenase-like lactoylglutathione lyase family enzyme